MLVTRRLMIIQLRKATTVLIGIATVMNSTIGSSLPSGDSDALARHFNVTIEEQLVLPNSIYLVGYVVGPLLFAPLSESHGRQIIMIGTFAGYTIFTLAACLAPNWAAFNIFRLFTGIFAASPNSVTGGIYADLYNSPVSRGRAMALFMTATTWGPILGPVISGYLAPYSWRWPFWCGLIIAGASAIAVACLPETYGPVILQRRAKKMRKANPGLKVWAPLDYETATVKDLVKVFLGRPFRMLFFEALVLFSCLFLSLIYAVLYMFFQAFPLIFPPVYGFSNGEEGLAFFGIGVGAIFACVIYLWWDHYLRAAKARNARWTQIEEYRRLPLACIGGPLFTIGLFWIGWSARPSVHWIVPILGGVPLGTGFLLLFMALLNFMVDAYEIFAASALAAAACCRSAFGAVLPFAAVPMYRSLGIAWASSLLGFASLACCVIPYAFISYGDKIRANSSFCQELAQKKRRECAEEVEIMSEERIKTEEQPEKRNPTPEDKV
ncbi:MAG: hypothetical protein M1828_005081 [Chrysothrix sp. TS-e1954]|nr:MAG: hypothetical protein M1828_005081 [Chrysothrix sp. TS-e1954]